MASLYRYTVRGNGPFPWHVAQRIDAAKVIDADLAKTQQCGLTLSWNDFDVTLEASRSPDAIAWATYGWRVVASERKGLDVS